MAIRRLSDLLTTRGLIPALYTGTVEPYAPSQHLRWVDDTVEYSASRARELSLRAAIRRSRLVGEVLRLWREWMSTQVYEKGADGVYRRVATTTDQPGEAERPTATQFKAGLLLGLAVTLGASLLPAVGKWLAQQPPRRR